MSIKMIAVDMDGTFLSDQKDYNRERFEELFGELQEKGIKFVVASGNQYDQLKSFFPEKQEKMSFIAENGANIIVEGEPYFNERLAVEIVLNVLKKVNTLAPEAIVVCGKKSAYVSKDMPADTFESVRFYYPSIKKLDKLEDIEREEDQIFKFALSFPNIHISEKLEFLTNELDGMMIPVSSGHGDIDLIIPGIHKAQGLSKLCGLWKIAPSEIAAFGDSGNDIEMLSYAGSSFAMVNAQPKVKEAAGQIIGSNNHEGVLDQIENLLKSDFDSE